VTILPGYDDRGPDDDPDGPGLGYDGAELLGRPGFWAAHLGDPLLLDLDDELAELFAVPLPAIRETYARLTDLTAWPIFPVELGAGARLAVVYRNFDEDLGVDYLRVPGPGATCVRIAAYEGGPDGPGIGWDELISAADRQATPLDSARALLLFLPVVTEVEAAGDEATDRVARALRTVGITGDVEDIAARLLDPDLTS
jgi:hypothetical protein